MDVAGALGFTAIFPAVLGVGLLIAAFVYYDERSSLDLREKMIFTRLWVSSAIFVFLASLGWITAIWMGYAQGAV